MTNFKLVNNDKVQKFIYIVKTIKLFNDYISFIFNHEKLYIQGMDSSHVCLYEINISKDWFNQYNYDSEESQIIISCNSNNLTKILSLCKTNQGLSIGFNNDDKLDIDIFDDILKQIKDNNSKDENCNINERSFTLNCLDIDFDTLTPEENDYDVDLYIQSKILSNIFSDLSLFGEDISINCSNNVLKLKTESTDNSMVQSISFDQLKKYDVIDSYNVNCKFQLSYLSNITNLQKVFSNVKISLQDDIPLCIYFEDTTELYVRFYLAPKIDD